MKTTLLSRRALTAVPFALLLLGGCIASGLPGEDESSRVDRSDQYSNPNSLGISNVHIMPMKTFSADSLNNQSAPAGAHLTYYGGPVLSNVKVYTIFWGGSAAVTSSSQINGFYTGVTNSTYFDWLCEYNTPTQSIGRGSFAGSYSYTNAPTGTIDDTQIGTDLGNLIKAGTIPAPDGNTLYAIHFAPGITITQGGQQSCVQFCAYHGTAQNNTGKGTGQYIFYSVIPDQGGSCAGGCGSSSNAFNNLTSVSSHELIESVTDAAVGLATGNSSPLAWYDNTNGEIGDICNGMEGSVLGGNGTTYTVQLEFSNKQNNCVVSGASCGSTSSSSSSSSTSTSSSSSSSSSSGTSSSSSSSSSTSTSSGGTCTHNECTTGVHLVKGCDACVTAVCNADPYCCTTQWDNVCVSEVPTYCGKSCSGGSSSSSSSSTSTSSSSSSSSSGGTCSHKLCSTGVKLPTSCNTCVAEICAQDSYCCINKWDSICVSEVGSICGETCPGN